jgi:hypothetical protein
MNLTHALERERERGTEITASAHGTAYENDLIGTTPKSEPEKLGKVIVTACVTAT